MELMPINIKVKFGRAVVALPTAESQVKTREGVVIYLQKRQTDYRAWATIPEGALEKYKHCQPEILSCEWEVEDEL